MSDGQIEEDMSSLAWPGFVDILSAVVIMFVFFVMVTAVALYMHTITYKSKLEQQLIESKQEIIRMENSEALSKKAKSLEEQVQEITDEKEALESVIAEYEEEFFQMRAEFSESKEQKIDIKSDENEIIIFFGRDSISMTQESQAAIQAFLQEKTSSGRKFKMKITGGKNPGAVIVSAAREITVARIFNVRNMLLTAKIDPSGISATVDNQKIEDTHHWVKVRLEEQ